MRRIVCNGKRNILTFVVLGAVALSVLTYRIPFQDRKFAIKIQIPHIDIGTSQDDIGQSPVNETWLERRKELLSMPGQVKKVIIFAYMRGGSSIIGETFGHDDSGFYWYEPLDQFYNDYFGYKIYSIPLHITYTLDGTRRVPAADETERLAQFFDDMYSCRLDKIPRETLIHPFMGVSVKTQPLRKCVKKINSCKGALPTVCSGPGPHLRDTARAIKYNCSGRINELRANRSTLNNLTNLNDKSKKPDEINFQKHEQCMRNLASITKSCIKRYLDVSICKKQTLQVSKVLRANMETMEQILHKIPDAYIVHYMRDPRAIAMSVKRVSAISFMAKNNEGVVMTELKMLCKKMKRDIEVRKELQMKYPGAFISLKYEKLVNDPQSSVKSVYSSIDRSVPSSLWKYLQNALHNTGAKEGSFSHVRRNATATSIAWKEKFPKENLVKASELCRDVLLEMGYTVDVST